MTVTAGSQAELFDQQGGAGFIALVEINHASLGAPIRVANDTKDCVSNGNTYTAYPFLITLPADKDGAPPTAKLTIDNVAQTMTALIRNQTVPPTVKISIVRMSAPNNVDVTLPTFTLRNVDIDITSISGDLLLDNVTAEPFPQMSFIPSFFPGLF